MPSVRGEHEMTAKLRSFQAKFPQRTGDALYTEIHTVEEPEAKSRTPVYTGPTGPGKPVPGVLRDSVHTEGPTYEGRLIKVALVAGGEAGAYAIPQHERLDYFHKTGQAKYIESVWMEARAWIASRVAARIQISKMRL